MSWEGLLPENRWWASQNIVSLLDTESKREKEGSKTQQGGRKGEYLGGTHAHT